MSKYHIFLCSYSGITGNQYRAKYLLDADAFLYKCKTFDIIIHSPVRPKNVIRDSSGSLIPFFSL